MEHYKYLYKHGTQEQIDRFHEARRRKNELARLMQEPPLYRPNPDMCGFIFAGSFQCGVFIEYQAELYRAGRYDSFRGVVNHNPLDGRRGWYAWGNDMASHMPGRIITEP